MSKSRLLLILAFLGTVLFFACKTGQISEPVAVDHFDTDRPNNPWVFRSVLDVQPRMLTVALNDNLWVAYSTIDCSLYKAWKGYVNFDGAVYTTAHGPQPTAIGDAWIENQVKSPWFIKQRGAETPVTAVFKGHRFEGTRVKIMYELPIAGGNILVEESPEYASEKSFPVFQRTFNTSNVPEGATVIFKGNASSVVDESKVNSDGTITYDNIQEITSGKISTKILSYSVQLNSNATTDVNIQFVAKPTIENKIKVDDEDEAGKRPAGFKLIARNDCKTCHNTYRKTIGPGYMEVAERYPNNEASIKLLTAKVQMGGSGVWGSQVMNAHPNVAENDIREMVSYIMSLDADTDTGETISEAVDFAKYPLQSAADVNEKNLISGISIRVKQFDSKFGIATIARFKKGKSLSTKGGIAGKIYAYGNGFGELVEDFSIEYTGYLKVEEDGVYQFRLTSDDGSNLILNNKLVIDNDGYHGDETVDGTIGLKKGFHQFEVDYFQGSGGRVVRLEWRKADGGEFQVIGSDFFKHTKEQEHNDLEVISFNSGKKIPGDKIPLDEVHPSYDLTQARPHQFMPRVGGLDFLSDGRMVISTWDAEGAVWLLTNVDKGDPNAIETKCIAKGLAEPLGLKVVDDVIYVLQKQELTKLVDLDGDDYIDEYQALGKNWKVSANFHEFAFGLAYKDGYFYGSLATAINPGGASTDPQIQDRGRAIKISKETGEVEFIAHGLRTPNGVGLGMGGEVFICDNQGDWLPSSKLVHLKKDAFYGSRSVNFEKTANLKEKKPVVWLPQDEIGNSPSTPMGIEDGPYKGQLIHGEVTHGGIKRTFVEEVNGELQGCVFRFVQGLEAGVNRMAYGPDGGLYIGGVGSTGNWQQNEKLWYGIQRLNYNGKSTFEMLAIRAKSNGVEIEFTEPLLPGDGWSKSDYEVRQWYYLPTKEYGGPKMDDRALNVRSVNVSADRKKVFLELDGMKEDHLVYVRLKTAFVSELSHSLWNTEGWYTMNAIPKGEPGTITQAPAITAMNTLSEYEKSQGWKLLFDGKTTNGWRNFKKKTIGKSWKVVDGAIMLNPEKKEDGAWQVKDGGDIITEGEYENYELKLEWKIANCGNSGIIHNVVESDEYDYVWQTGPEMQILDNTCHPDAKIKTHRAGDLYDMIECKYITVNPAGQWNKIRLIVNNGKLEHWQNGHMVVETQMFDENWTKMIANSKFKEMPGFGTAKKGHISLQDHGDQVWFRNIKIKELDAEM